MTWPWWFVLLVVGVANWPVALVSSPHEVIQVKCQCMGGLKCLGLVVQVQR